MKKILVLLLSVAAIVLASCASVPKDYYTALETGTPENSVLVYGTMASASYMVFAQSSPDFPVDIQEAVYPDQDEWVFCLKPVAPGSYYKMAEVFASNSRSYISEYCPLTGTIWDFAVPKKPGLYYYGSYHFYASENERVAFKNSKKTTDTEQELYALEILKDKFKKTAWGNPIQKRIDELKGAKK